MTRAPAPNAIEVLGWAWHQRAVPARRVPAPAPGRTRVAARLGLAASTLGILGFLGGFLAFVDALQRVERLPEGRADGIVALTGGAQRIGDAIDLLAGGYGRRLLITGVNERTSRDEIARLNPTQRTLIACCVDLDYRARNTIGNAIETRRWMRAHRFSTVTVVTSNYHMPRTLIELDHALQDSERVVPHAVVAESFDPDRWWQSLPAARLLASEYVKFLVSWVRTRFEDDPERSRAAILIGRGKPVKMVAEPLIRTAN
ncbi:YdcF family protein [Methylobacterium sp. NEAU 140]|uniref:YdcF family protein n=1 Tax=Methylobacterium sp. NEAU 140 TaxID=3064945 RepID=UPI0027324B7C|nr:YdcF family protein [Methylobacterium sp. NEAU 140]MDP4021074.1 YdcF family protein [Methylobacterium sp. NEAU 140]